MKTCYADKKSYAIADLVPPGELTMNWTITRINVPLQYRGQGIGSKLLDQICNDADKDDVSLQLEIQASDGLDYDALESWYKSRGFKLLANGYYRRASAVHARFDETLRDSRRALCGIDLVRKFAGPMYGRVNCINCLAIRKAANV